MALPDLSTVGPSRELVEGAGLESVIVFLSGSLHEKREGDARTYRIGAERGKRRYFFDEKH